MSGVCVVVEHCECFSRCSCDKMNWNSIELLQHIKLWTIIYLTYNIRFDIYISVTLYLSLFKNNKNILNKLSYVNCPNDNSGPSVNPITGLFTDMGLSANFWELGLEKLDVLLI